jgi:hypothetical protein
MQHHAPSCHASGMMPLVMSVFGLLQRPCSIQFQGSAAIAAAASVAVMPGAEGNELHGGWDACLSAKLLAAVCTKTVTAGLRHRCIRTESICVAAAAAAVSRGKGMHSCTTTIAQLWWVNLCCVLCGVAMVSGVTLWGSCCLRRCEAEGAYVSRCRSAD